jgi:hypothetical protein
VTPSEVYAVFSSELESTVSTKHKPVITLEELNALEDSEIMRGYMEARKGDPEPGANHSRAYHHGWRTRMMDLGEIEITPEHHDLTRLYCEDIRRKRA